MEKEAKSLPKITINKIIKESLPEDVKCTAESQQLILNCCMEFLQLISSEANDICSKQNKKVIVPEHILNALQKLGFEKYIEDLKMVHAEHKRQEANKPKISKRLEDSGLTQEELLKKQKELFAKAKSALKQNTEQTEHHEETTKPAGTTATVAAPTKPTTPSPAPPPASAPAPAPTPASTKVKKEVKSNASKLKSEPLPSLKQEHAPQMVKMENSAPSDLPPGPAPNNSNSYGLPNINTMEHPNNVALPPFHSTFLPPNQPMTLMPVQMLGVPMQPFPHPHAYSFQNILSANPNLPMPVFPMNNLPLLFPGPPPDSNFANPLHGTQEYTNPQHSDWKDHFQDRRD